MLRFIKEQGAQRARDLNFNTSNVTVHLIGISGAFGDSIISIHPMLRFI